MVSRVHCINGEKKSHGPCDMAARSDLFDESILKEERNLCFCGYECRSQPCHTPPLLSAPHALHDRVHCALHQAHAYT